MHACSIYLIDLVYYPWAPWLRDVEAEVLDGVPRGDERAYGVEVAAENISPSHTLADRCICLLAVQCGIWHVNYLNSHTGRWCSISHLSVGTIESGASIQVSWLQKY